MFKHCLNMEIIRNVVGWGNSAGILLPREWKGKEAKIVLIDRSLQIKKEVFDILDDYLDDILGIYLVGSYARGEENSKSDVDVLVITNKINKIIKSGKYDVIMLPKETYEKQLENDILPLLPMIKEARTLLNSNLIEKYKNTPLTRKNLRFHIQTTKSAMRVVREAIKLSKIDKKDCGDSIAYSLILRLREAYIVGCLIKNRKFSNKELLGLIDKIAGSREAYEGYLRVKNDKKREEKLKTCEAEKLMSYILDRIDEQNKWVKRRR